MLTDSKTRLTMRFEGGDARAWRRPFQSVFPSLRPSDIAAGHLSDNNDELIP